MSKECSICNKEFFRPTGRRKSDWTKVNTCSLPCKKILLSKKLLGNKNGRFRKNRYVSPLSIQALRKWSAENKPWNYGKGVKSKQNELVRKRKDMREWRQAVFERDDYTCQLCGIRGGDLNADHIKSFAFFPELRTQLTNGRTLCIPCHKETKNYGRKAFLTH